MKTWVKGVLVFAGIDAVATGVMYGVRALIYSRKRKELGEHIKTFGPEGEESRVLMFRNRFNCNDFIVIYGNDTLVRFDNRTWKYHDVYDYSTNSEYSELWWEEVPESMYSK